MAKNQTDLTLSINGAITAVLTPLFGALLIANFTSGMLGLNNAPHAAFFGALGLISWFMGMSRFGLAEVGLRGKRPLLSGIGFAVIGWLGFVLIRVFTVAIDGTTTPSGLSQPFFYLLIFEAFCVQLWAFGLCFRSIAAQFGAVIAAIVSGILFGLIGTFYFQESFGVSVLAPLYFIIWGIFYGFVRLRTGSLIGMVLVQAMQSLVAWKLLAPELPITTENSLLSGLYLGAALIYGLMIWRLWPKEADDIRL